MSFLSSVNLRRIPACESGLLIPVAVRVFVQGDGTAATPFQTDTFPAICRVQKIFQIRLEFLCFTQQKQISVDPLWL